MGLSEYAYGNDMVTTPIKPYQEIMCNYSATTTIALEVYNQMRAININLNCLLEKEELSYYATAMLWLRLIEVKSKQGVQELTDEENAILKSVWDSKFNIPRPIADYLKEIGKVTYVTGVTTNLHIPPLPITTIGELGGYHANAITVDNHNLFEEVPCLGIAGDLVMALTQESPQPIPNFRLETPAGAQINTNLAGNTLPIRHKRNDKRLRLTGMHITPDTFPEDVPGTRYNYNYLQHISDTLETVETFTMIKVRFSKQTANGGNTQYLKSVPNITEDGELNWRDRTTTICSPEKTSAMNIGAAFVFKFQLYKEPGSGADVTEQHAKWCCLEADPNAEHPWVIPSNWIVNRNARRQLPGAIGIDAFRSLSDRQDRATFNIIRHFNRESDMM